MTTLGIIGSARGDGNTRALTDTVFENLPDAQLVDLTALRIGPYDYNHANADDDFLPLAQRMVAASTIVFASPVYWYSMSAPMKTFFDRLTDLTGPHKSLGKALAGKRVFVIATGGSPVVPASFEQPFVDTAGYFNMTWGGLLYAPGVLALSDETRDAAIAFAAGIMAKR